MKILIPIKLPIAMQNRITVDAVKNGFMTYRLKEKFPGFFIKILSDMRTIFNLYTKIIM